ncbi:MAG TPA: hypothetical protein ENN69_06015 [Spirochaetia bacterium]|nr:hypothetical protein [Spirochaetia bacterium]
MWKLKYAVVAALLGLLSGPLPADRILYAEQYYELYHQHLYQYPDDSLENIRYLELALKADFANPLYAIARITDTTEYARYRSLFRMHVNLKLIEQYLHLGSKFDKFELYFFHREGPWRGAICDSLGTAEWAYRSALRFWDEALKWSDEAFRLRGVHLPEIQKWEDENFRIETDDLNYARIIRGHLDRVAEARAYLNCTP